MVCILAAKSMPKLFLMHPIKTNVLLLKSVTKIWTEVCSSCVLSSGFCRTGLVGSENRILKLHRLQGHAQVPILWFIRWKHLHIWHIQAALANFRGVAHGGLGFSNPPGQFCKSRKIWHSYIPWYRFHKGGCTFWEQNVRFYSMLVFKGRIWEILACSYSFGRQITPFHLKKLSF